jgi:hypothetical protein
MTVHCEGDCALMEQLGERYEFESELTWRGFRHEEFTLHVLRDRAPRGQTEWVQRYAVTVANVRTERYRVYRSDSRSSWVPCFAHDLAAGAFGAPIVEKSTGSNARRRAA